VTITAVNDAPVATGTTVTTNYNTAKTITLIGTSLVTDIDTPDSGLSIAVVGNPSHGTVTLSTDGKSFIYTPAVGFNNGTDAFTYKANDGQLDSNVATVTINVSGHPPTGKPTLHNATENTTVTVPAPGVLAGASDPDGDSLTAVLVTNVPANKGVVTLNPDGSFVFTPVTGVTGSLTFTIKVQDSTGLLSATVNVAVVVNGHKPVAVNDSYNATRNTLLSVPASSGVLVNDTDEDNDVITTATLVTGPSHAASFTLNANGSFSYTPATGYTGTDSFTYKAKDATLLTSANAATVTITVAPPQ
jgi:VCBS repeat-containing protein